MTKINFIGHWSFVIRRFLFSFFLSTTAALAQGPHEIVLLINQNSPASLEVAHHYAQLRRVPASNLIYLDVPEQALGTRAELSQEQFKRHIYEPVIRAIETRRLQDHILAWIYSVDFPVRITTPSPVSLTGITFTRGEFPGSEQVDKGLYASPFFRGPDKPGEAGLPPGSLQEYAVLLRDKMPIPAMLLGHAGSRGLSADAIVDSLRRAAAADGTRPRDGIYFHVSDDARSTCRRWQFDGAVAELNQIGIPAQTSSNRPVEGAALSGLMLGTAFTADSWGRFQPGSIVDNLTSFGALFHTHEQTRLTHWIAAGASASAGTVVEPLSIWTKFPHARLFAHYARGCTALESYMQAVRSPLQLLLVGDPLVKPWSAPIPLTLISMEDAKKPLRGDASFLVSSLAPIPGSTYLFMLNGRSLPAGGKNPGLKLDTTGMPDGHHELSVVAYSPGPIRRQGHGRIGFTVNNAGRFTTLARTDGATNTLDYYRPFTVQVAADGAATSVVITAHERVLWQGPASTQAQTVSLSPADIGPGPVSLQASARYADGMAVHSVPLSIQIQRLNQPPGPPAIATTATADGNTRLLANSTDPDGDVVRITWFQNRLASEPPAPITTANAEWRIPGATGSVAILLPESYPDLVREVVFGLRTISPPHSTGDQVAGLVFAASDEQNYACFGWHWQEGGWVLGRVVDGKLTRLATRGMPLNPRRPHDIRLVQEGENVVAYVDGERVAAAAMKLTGRFGISGGMVAFDVTRLGISPSPGWNAADATNAIAAPPANPRTPLLIRAADPADAAAWTALP
ncbi:MAG TPA: hypothetical protein PKE12_09100 [Kiritimatiellia bacterium]|nr:hypothetical protein [Kiritimatiellia bacterium]